ncbi:MAG TPA: hemolysin family protein [Candidatus Binatia bacterium]|jgi:CBS domain containing-hemolysin-like protein|nr:hemolysin family protein [Candidatus Binatia bacterium]
MANIAQILWRILLVLGLVLLNGFFVAAEFALVRIRETQLDTLVTKGNRRAKIARSIVAHLNSYLSATQLGITMVSLGLGWAGEPVFNVLLSPLLTLLHVESEAARHSIAFAVGFSVLTFLHITAGELAPKWMAIQNPLPLSLAVARPLKWFYLASYPFNWLLNRAAQGLLRLVGFQSVTEAKRAPSHEELRLVVATSQKYGGGTVLGREIVLNALDLGRRLAREVMRPRHEMVPLDTESSITECLDVAEKTRYSRFPLCEGGNLDKTLGVIHIKDLYAMRLKARRGADLLPAARKLIYVPETAHLEKLLKLFLERKLHLAIVVDEYGDTVGMVTLENILEELVGQIQDEFDQEKPLLVRTSETAWEAAGALPLHELEEIIGGSLREEGITTVSGWVTQRLGGFPKAGDVLPIGAYELRVEAMDGMRVARLKLAKRLEERSG